MSHDHSIHSLLTLHTILEDMRNDVIVTFAEAIVGKTRSKESNSTYKEIRPSCPSKRISIDRFPSPYLSVISTAEYYIREMDA